MIFTFWEGKMPDYIKLCLETWKVDYVILNYKNLHEYTDLKIDDNLKRLTLPQQADCVRVHVLRDNGGYWLDADTIMLTDKLLTENMIGNPIKRTNTIGYLHTEPHSQMFNEWAEYQERVVSEFTDSLHSEFKWSWDMVGNAFTDKYVKEHPEITIADVTPCWAETYMMPDPYSRYEKYRKFYFTRSFNLSDLKPTDMLMLHNSWTPDYYKRLSKNSILDRDCTLSNILREVLA